jgi:D-alanyl-D-alanine carboxypeptidase (penicillin-binding protein 5/6)
MNKFLFISILFFALTNKVLANPNLQARTGVLIDYHSDEILFELDSNAQIYPASMTKIMTAIVTFDLLKKK